MPINKSANAAIAAVAAGSSDLILTLNGNPIKTDQYVSRAETQSQPEIRYSKGQGKTFVAVMLDMDAPFPSFNFLSPILHWIQPGLVMSGDMLESSAPVICNYVGAGPPPGSGPHQYVLFLYEQPANFDAKKFAPSEGQQTGLAKRVRFDLDKFEQEAGLGEIVACNYFKSN